MLRSLDIRNVLIIDQLSLNFQAGLNVLTGETGAGKSILLDALGFSLGWRGKADLTAEGADQGEVTVVFDLAADHAARAVLSEAGIVAEDELILRRTSTPDGRKAAFINDRRVSAEVLRDLSDHLVELHGQHDDRGLLNPRGHRALLDSFAGVDITPLRTAWRDQSSARSALADADATAAAALKEEDFLRHAVAELGKLDPKAGEDGILDAKRRRMQASDRIRGDIVRALATMTDGAEMALAEAQRWLGGAQDRADGKLDGALAALGRCLTELSEAQAGVEDCLAAMDFDPSDLEATEERLFAIRALARKHGVLPDALADFHDRMKRKLAALETASDTRKALVRAVAAAEATYLGVAKGISVLRKEAAKRLDLAMAQELSPLKMERAIFTTELSAADPGPEGIDAVTFTVATNPGAPKGPLNRIASGGELSRFLLALKVCLKGDTPGLTMIFDEIDRGLGGATANAVGRRLKDLASTAQVLVVTHSPQVAALGTHHWRVEKRVTSGRTISTVVALSPQERVEEIARMLAGDTVTDAARQAARSLLGHG